MKCYDYLLHLLTTSCFSSHQHWLAAMNIKLILDSNLLIIQPTSNWCWSHNLKLPFVSNHDVIVGEHAGRVLGSEVKTVGDGGWRNSRRIASFHDGQRISLVVVGPHQRHQGAEVAHLRTKAHPWSSWTNEAPSDVNKTLDGSTYPRKKLGCFSQLKIFLLFWKHNRLYPEQVLPPTCWWTPIGAAP